MITSQRAMKARLVRIILTISRRTVRRDGLVRVSVPLGGLGMCVVKRLLGSRQIGRALVPAVVWDDWSIVVAPSFFLTSSL